MSLPTPPLALSATYLSVLQTRPNQPAVEAPRPDPKGSGEQSSPSGYPAVARGRLIDILV